MERIQRQRMLWRIPLAAAILVTLLWGIWYLAGEVPTTSQVKWGENAITQIPSMSRFWDIVFAPIWAFILVFIFTSKKFREERGDKSLINIPIASLTAGLIIGLIFGLSSGLGASLVFGLIIGLVVGLIIGLIVGLLAGLKFLFSRKLWIDFGHWLAGKI